MSDFEVIDLKLAVSEAVGAIAKEAAKTAATISCQQN